MSNEIKKIKILFSIIILLKISIIFLHANRTNKKTYNTKEYNLISDKVKIYNDLIYSYKNENEILKNKNKILTKKINILKKQTSKTIKIYDKKIKYIDSISIDSNILFLSKRLSKKGINK